MIRKLEKGGEYYFNRNNFTDTSYGVAVLGPNADVWIDENNFLHNEPNIPTCISYAFGNRKDVTYKTYQKHGVLHNLFGSAYISYYIDGLVECENYYINGEELSKEEWGEKVYIERNRILMLSEI